MSENKPEVIIANVETPPEVSTDVRRRVEVPKTIPTYSWPMTLPHGMRVAFYQQPGSAFPHPYIQFPAGSQDEVAAALRAEAARIDAHFCGLATANKASDE